MKKREPMKIVSWNVNGIRSVLKKGFVEWIRQEKPDVLCLQETKANKEQVDHKLEEYQQYWNSGQKAGYSGTAVFTKLKPLSVSFDDPLVCEEKEGRITKIEFKEFYLVNVYKPNSQRGLVRLKYRKEWDKKFLNYVKELEKKKPVIICGDLNVAHKEIDLANPKSNYNKTAGYTQIEIDGFEELVKAGYIDSFREFHKEPGKYTYWGFWNNLRKRNIGWRIDYFLVSKKAMSKVKESFILEKVMGSDHCPVGIDLRV